MQAGPQDGVAADALPAPSTPAVPTPPTKASVVATESTLLLMDMEIPLLEPPAVPCARLGRAGPPQHATIAHVRPARHAAGSRWPDQDRTADPIGLAVLERESPRASPEVSLWSKPDEYTQWLKLGNK